MCFYVELKIICSNYRLEGNYNSRIKLISYINLVIKFKHHKDIINISIFISTIFHKNKGQDFEIFILKVKVIQDFSFRKIN
ncbi:Uncharacterised protein [Legionella busanensis]|uniref:Uncharacterized protein n=1 Tax=Legionella busanensis TaxID=190655 RepID=A0A378K9Y2_9GAMM|nr:Uncharacterised protein [Legionella busanensis]